MQLLGHSRKMSILDRQLGTKCHRGYSLKRIFHSCHRKSSVEDHRSAKVGSMRSAADQAAMQCHDMITDQPYIFIDSSTRSGPYSFKPHSSTMIVTPTLVAADTRDESEYWRRGEDPNSYSAHVSSDDWQCHYDSDKESEKPVHIADHVSSITVASTSSDGSDSGIELRLFQKSHVSSPRDNPSSVPHTPKRQHVVEADSIMPDDGKVHLQDVGRTQHSTTRAYILANEPRTPSPKRIATAQTGEQDDAINFQMAASIASWAYFDSPP
ncbi:hypothetical protein JB92DRAFT_1238112 [Gautieria morchelliformis]|nr:hypothetical protein JB92DRAFT_1238112 [Gautieria morchelliformis]